MVSVVSSTPVFFLYGFLCTSSKRFELNKFCQNAFLFANAYPSRKRFRICFRICFDNSILWWSALAALALFAIIVGNCGFPKTLLLVHLQKLIQFFLFQCIQYIIPCNVVSFAVPMFDSKYYGTNVVFHFHPKLVSTFFFEFPLSSFVVLDALVNLRNKHTTRWSDPRSTSSVAKLCGTENDMEHRMKSIRLRTPMQLQNVQVALFGPWWPSSFLILHIKILCQICQAITSNTNVQLCIKIHHLTPM